MYDRIIYFYENQAHYENTKELELHRERLLVFTTLKISPITQKSLSGLGAEAFLRLCITAAPTRHICGRRCYSRRRTTSSRGAKKNVPLIYDGGRRQRKPNKLGHCIWVSTTTPVLCGLPGQINYLHLSANVMLLS